MKLVIAEAETDSLREALVELPARASSVLVRVEVVRAARRASRSSVARAERLVRSLSLIDVTPRIVAGAAGVEPATLRTIDAIHLASALALGDALRAFVCYDRRLADAARAAGLNVLAPA